MSSVVVSEMQIPSIPKSAPHDSHVPYEDNNYDETGYVPNYVYGNYDRKQDLIIVILYNCEFSKERFSFSCQIRDKFLSGSVS